MGNYKGAVRNTQRGIRGLNTVNGYRDLAPGEMVESVELTEAEHRNAETTGYFEFGDSGGGGRGDPDKPKADDADDLDTTMDGLEAIAKAEAIDLSGIAGTGTNGRVLKSDVQAAIRAAREAKANPAKADDLDNMDDATLRVTVQAITGKEPPADADRAALLKLARGQE